MKVLPFQIPKPAGENLVYQEDYELVFYDQLHQHEEIQISYIHEGIGSLVVADSITTYNTDDIIVIGSNIPHVFKSNSNVSKKSRMYTLFFTKQAFGENFFNISDLSDLEDIFLDASQGFKIQSDKTALIKEFKKLKELNKIELIASLLVILNLFVRANKKQLSSFIFKKKYTEKEGKRMNVVINYSLDNFFEPITLDEIAEKANMTKNAFCRYFKKRTNKTFFGFLVEIRIENACILLRKNNAIPISEIAKSCGFQNIANFNRKFQKIKMLTPTQYRKNFNAIY